MFLFISFIVILISIILFKCFLKIKKIKVEEQNSDKMLIQLREGNISIDDYKKSLNVVSLSNDEIDILNVLFEREKGVVKIKQIVHIDGKPHIIEPNTKFNFSFIWCDDNYWENWPFFISNMIFEDQNTTAILHYGVTGGALAERGYVAKLTKKENQWSLISDEFEWMS